MDKSYSFANLNRLAVQIRKGEARMKMAWFAGSMPQMKWPGKQMREPFGCN